MATDRTLNDLRSRRQAVAYMYAELGPFLEPSVDHVFFFQYWPEQVSDSKATGMVDKTIPGGSDPIQQWVGGTPRTISFEAKFTAEVQDPGIAARGIPSERYTVDLIAAKQKIRSYQYGLYRNGGQLGITDPPPRLNLVLPNMALGRDKDTLLVTLRDASVTHVKSFPDGTPRIMYISLSFQESIQFLTDSGEGVKFVGRDRFTRAENYRYSGGGREALLGGG